MEKILKLIKSPCRDDLEIGIRLLLSLPFTEILEFFKEHGNHDKYSEDVINIDLSANASKSRDFEYIDLGDDYYFIRYHKWLRMKKPPANLSTDIPVVSLKEYLYGEDI